MKLMFSWYKYLIVCLVFSHLGFRSGSLFLIAHFPDLCLLVLFFINDKVHINPTSEIRPIDDIIKYRQPTKEQLLNMRVNVTLKLRAVDFIFMRANK